jgi:hypothetical protein
VISLTAPNYQGSIAGPPLCEKFKTQCLGNLDGRRGRRLHSPALTRSPPAAFELHRRPSGSASFDSGRDKFIRPLVNPLPDCHATLLGQMIMSKHRCSTVDVDEMLPEG